MRRLFLAHEIRTKIGPITGITEANGTWERLPTGDFIVRVKNDPDEYWLPATSVRYEQRQGSKPDQVKKT